MDYYLVNAQVLEPRWTGIPSVEGPCHAEFHAKNLYVHNILEVELDFCLRRTPWYLVAGPCSVTKGSPQARSSHTTHVLQGSSRLCLTDVNDISYV